MKKLTKIIVSLSILTLFTPLVGHASTTDSNQNINIEARSIRKKHFVLHYDMPSNWNPPSTRYAERSSGGIRYGGTLRYVGSGRKDGRITAVYSGYLYEIKNGYVPLKLEKARK